MRASLATGSPGPRARRGPFVRGRSMGGLLLAAMAVALTLGPPAASAKPRLYPVEPGGYGCFQAYGSLTPHWPGTGQLFFNPRFCANGVSVASVDPSWRGCYGGGSGASWTTCDFTNGPFVVAGCVGCTSVTYQFGAQFTYRAPWPYGYTEYRVINCRMTRYGQWSC
jgi:hypothetical protein